MSKQKTAMVIAITTVVVIAFTIVIAILSYRIGRSQASLQLISAWSRKLSPECLDQLSTP